MSMKNIQTSNYIIISSTCKAVEGKYHSVIIDYQREELLYIPKEYCRLLINIDRKRIVDVENILDDEDSIEYFHQFLSFLQKKEIAFFTDDISVFPKINDKMKDTPCLVNNAIIEIDSESFDASLLCKICQELENVLCQDVQIRFLGQRWIGYISLVCSELSNAGVRYIETMGVYNESENRKLKTIISDIPLLSRVYVFESPSSEIIEVTNDETGDKELAYGEIYYTRKHYDHINGCGIINQQTMDFSSIHSYNRYKSVNGCLYKKVSITKDGLIKNCPSLMKTFGNIKAYTLKDVICNPDFMNIWYVAKDEIECCKDCELRYCCSDCRAFVEEANNVYSKPLKCSYNILNGTWEEEK